MDEISLCDKLTFSQLEGCRKKGRLKLRWLDDVLQDLKFLMVRAWWKKAQDRARVGRLLSRRSRLTKGCSAR
jgi:hypothetical protein